MTIYFGGVEMPAPKLNGGLVETYENVWSADTGRNSAGRMMGTLVATKAKLKFSWNALSWADAAKIRNAIYGAGFTTCTYPGVVGQDHTVNVYSASTAGRTACAGPRPSAWTLLSGEGVRR